MKKALLIIAILLIRETLSGQSFHLKGQDSLNYVQSKLKMMERFKNVKSGKFGEFAPGVITRIASSRKIAALTFDACGGPTGSGYDTALVAFLKREKIQATLFIAGSWIEKNDSLFRQLCAEPLFEVENHGLLHRPCSVTARSRYGIASTENVGDVFDEIEMNACQIELYSKRKPQFYRPAAAASDEGCISIAKELKEKVITYDVLSGDAVVDEETSVIKKNILKKTKPGSIIIMHMNHPERNGFEALQEVVPVLRKQGYVFVKLEGYLGSRKK